jgi:hypothetical protein
MPKNQRELQLINTSKAHIITFKEAGWKVEKTA